MLNDSNLEALRAFKYKSRPSEDFFRATNAIFGKIGRVASEEVVLELVKCKCLSIVDNFHQN